jgi:uncharacterized protein (DUF2225 family)
MAHIRFRNRETPKGEIECQIGETVNPKKVCPKCAYATGCPDYESYLRERHRRQRAEVRRAIEEHGKRKSDSEIVMEIKEMFEIDIGIHQTLTKVKLELQYRYWQLRVWFDNHKLRYWSYE